MSDRSASDTGRAVGVELEGLRVSFGDSLVLSDVDLVVEPGSVAAIVGPSGSGKTTMLRCVAGLVRPDGGDVRFDGRSVLDVAVHRRGVGYVFQEYALFPHRKVLANVTFGLEMAGWSKREGVARARELLSLVGLGDAGGRNVSSLSGGEQQRVALARALAPRPGLLLLDEPFGALDRLRRAELVREVGELIADLGVTAIHVTHDQDEAAALGHTITVLEGGEVLQTGTPEQVATRPRSRRVAEFMGHQVLEGHLDRAMVSLTPTWSVGPFDLSSASSASATGRVALVVPPWAVRIRSGLAESTDATVIGQTLGPSGHQVVLAVGGIEITAATGPQHHEVGDQVQVSILTDECHLLS